jgi:ubiquinone/menaquinone biosynthesis C-methylase UbiE
MSLPVGSASPMLGDRINVTLLLLQIQSVIFQTTNGENCLQYRIGAKFITHTVMAVKQDTLWDRFLSPLIQGLIDQEQMLQLRDKIDWEQTIEHYQSPAFSYPDYYRTQNFHGIEGGYLTQTAAISYDPITQYVLPPYEPWVRQRLIMEVRSQPRRILDLGCGTGSTTLLLQQAYPYATVTGLDLSPYMLAVAQDKANQADLDINWQHGTAESTQFAPASFDLITASLLFHETPPAITQAILAESWRLLAPGGQILILDGNQRTLRSLDWLNNVFEEPYIQAYAAGNLDAWMGKAGFDEVQTKDVFGLNQLTSGIRYNS